MESYSLLFWNTFLQHTLAHSSYVALGKVEEKVGTSLNAKIREQSQWNLNHTSFRSCKSKQKVASLTGSTATTPLNFNSLSQKAVTKARENYVLFKKPRQQLAWYESSDSTNLPIVIKIDFMQLYIPCQQLSCKLHCMTPPDMFTEN